MDGQTERRTWTGRCGIRDAYFGQLDIFWVGLRLKYPTSVCFAHIQSRFMKKY